MAVRDHVLAGLEVGHLCNHAPPDHFGGFRGFGLGYQDCGQLEDHLFGIGVFGPA